MDDTAYDDTVQLLGFVLVVSNIPETCDLLRYVTTLFQVKTENIRQ